MPPERIDKIINTYDAELAACLKHFVGSVSPNKLFDAELQRSIDKMSLAQKFFVARVTVIVARLVADGIL